MLDHGLYGLDGFTRIFICGKIKIRVNPSNPSNLWSNLFFESENILIPIPTVLI
jgi:hypothetical protein